MLSFNAAILINAQLVCANYVFIFWIIDQSRLMILILGQILMTNKENSHFTAKEIIKFTLTNIFLYERNSAATVWSHLTPALHQAGKNTSARRI